MGKKKMVGHGFDLWSCFFLLQILRFFLFLPVSSSFPPYSSNLFFKLNSRSLALIALALFLPFLLLVFILDVSFLDIVFSLPRACSKTLRTHFFYYYVCVSQFIDVNVGCVVQKFCFSLGQSYNVNI